MAISIIKPFSVERRHVEPPQALRIAFAFLFIFFYLIFNMASAFRTLGSAGSSVQLYRCVVLFVCVRLNASVFISEKKEKKKKKTRRKERIISVCSAFASQHKTLPSCLGWNHFRSKRKIEEESTDCLGVEVACECVTVCCCWCCDAAGWLDSQAMPAVSVMCSLRWNRFEWKIERKTKGNEWKKRKKIINGIHAMPSGWGRVRPAVLFSDEINEGMLQLSMPDWLAGLRLAARAK